MSKPDLLERLCRSLAFHLVETELTLQHTEGDDLSLWEDECTQARSLITEAGFDIDALYPVEERPTTGSEH